MAHNRGSVNVEVRVSKGELTLETALQYFVAQGHEVLAVRFDEVSDEFVASVEAEGV